MTTAQTILAQLGANKFIAMTGAKNFVAAKNALHFDLPRGAKNGINKLNIELAGDDTYTVKFYKLRGLNLSLIETVQGVYADALQRVFSDVTDLQTSL